MFSNFIKNCLFVVSAVCLVAVAGCLDGGSGSEGGTDGDGTPNTHPTVDPTKTVCDPFQQQIQAKPDRGLISELFYLTDDQPRYSSVLDMMQFGHKVDSTLYFNRLDIPTRPFDRGFYTQSGDLITTINGNSLYEYFGLRFTSDLKLATGESPGAYQFAILADDGAILTLNIDGTDQVIVNDDGTHPTKMACASLPVNLSDGQTIPFKLIYHQGPRYHIALKVMWRPWPAAGGDPVVDTWCNQSGNSLFFDSTQDPPAPQTAYYDLLSRGWKVLDSGNFKLPSGDPNPCAQQPVETPLEIQAVNFSGITQTSVTVNWTTNIPASSQVSYKVVSTGVTNLSALDSSLTTTHSVTVSGLSANTLYGVRAISTTPGGQNISSDEAAFRTLR